MQILGTNYLLPKDVDQSDFAQADQQEAGVVLSKMRKKVMRATGGIYQPWVYGILTGGELVLSRVRR